MHRKPDIVDGITLIIALCSITAAASLFIKPAIYHHLHYPYRDLEKFEARSHRFILLGLIAIGLAIYLSLALVLHSVMEYPASFLFFLHFRRSFYLTSSLGLEKECRTMLNDTYVTYYGKLSRVRWEPYGISH